MLRSIIFHIFSTSLNWISQFADGIKLSLSEMPGWGRGMHSVIVSGWKSTWMSSRVKGNQLKGEEKKALRDAHEMILLSNSSQSRCGERVVIMEDSPMKWALRAADNTMMGINKFLETNQVIYFNLYSKPWRIYICSTICKTGHFDKEKQTTKYIQGTDNWSNCVLKAIFYLKKLKILFPLKWYIYIYR